MLSKKPHQFAGGGHCTFSLLMSSVGIPFKPGASVEWGVTPAITIKPRHRSNPWHSGSDSEEQRRVQDSSAGKYFYGSSKLIRLVVGE